MTNLRKATTQFAAHALPSKAGLASDHNWKRPSDSGRMMTVIRRTRIPCWLGSHTWDSNSWYDDSEGWCHKCRWCGRTGQISIWM